MPPKHNDSSCVNMRFRIDIIPRREPQSRRGNYADVISPTALQRERRDNDARDKWRQDISLPLRPQLRFWICHIIADSAALRFSA